MKRIITALIALGMTTGCSKEVQTLPANLITQVTGTTVSESIPVTSQNAKSNIDPPEYLILDTLENLEI